MSGYSQGRCLQQLFETQAERTPLATAVAHEGLELTYEELNRRANQLAHYLQKRGVGPEVLVGICIERSLEMVVGLLGILKAGGAYVPLDPTYPQERLAFMLKDAQVSVLLTQERLVVRLPKQQGQLIALDTDWETIAHESTENPVIALTLENLACVLYTSGSTGKPKGVMLEHHSVAHYTEFAGTEFALQPGDRFLQFFSLSFDPSLQDIFSCLSRGATVVLRNEAMIASLSAFLQKCHDLALTVLDLPTGYWHELTTKLGPSEPFVFPRSLRLVIIGGERALWKQLSVWQQHVGRRVRLLNMYGPTEGTVAATMCDLSEMVETPSQEVPIGRAIRNVQTYILDQRLQHVSVGEPGELYIGGAGLARGYLNRPELTAERFIPHPFSTEPGARLYKTGDRARYLPNGDLEFLGRTDDQVKVRGFRIELGEIEAVLAQHPAVRQTVVVAREERPGDKRLVAYSVPAQLPVPHNQELHDFLHECVPDYMVPSAFVWLETLPLTPNGKVDRRALPVPSQTVPELMRDFVAPRDALERQLAKMWEAALTVKSVGVRDNFFELGGHSLLAIRLYEQMERKFGRHLSPAILFQAPTIEQVANRLRQNIGMVPSRSLAVPFQADGSKPPFFCVFSSPTLALQLGSDQPVYALQPHGLAGRRAPATIEAAAADYIKEIQILQPTGPYFLGGYSFGGLVVFEVAQQLYQQGHQIAFLALLDPLLPPGKPSSDPVGPRSLHSLINSPRVRERLAGHARTLARLSPKEQLAYGQIRIKGRLTVIKKIICQLYLGTGRRLPLTLRTFYFLETCVQASQRYVPRVYPGRVVLFRTQESDAHLSADWGRLVAGDLEVYDVPGNHSDIFNKEPYIGTLAVKLRDCLSQAQTAPRLVTRHRL